MWQNLERTIWRVWGQIALCASGRGLANALVQPLALLGALCGWLSSLRLSLYDRGYLPSWQVGAFVLSVGNLSCGGSGKTPMVEQLVREFAEEFRVAIVTRGYRGRLSKRGARVDGLRGPLFSAQLCGDEPHLLAGKLTAPVFVDADRVRGSRSAVETSSSQLIILDDGFQHRRLRRQRELLLIDASSTEPAALCLPVGPLRNRWKESARADFILITGAISTDHYEQAAAHLKKYTASPLAGASFVLSDLIPLTDWQRRFAERSLSAPTEGAPALLRLYICCGLANPARFLHTLTRAGYQVVGAHYLPDHAQLTSRGAGALVQRARAVKAQAIVCSEKDAVKWSVSVKPLPVLVATCALKVRHNRPAWQLFSQNLRRELIDFCSSKARPFCRERFELKGE